MGINRPLRIRFLAGLACLAALLVLLSAVWLAQPVSDACAAPLSGSDCQKGLLFSDPDCVKPQPEHTYCVTRGYDNAVWIKVLHEDVAVPYWTDFTSLGGIVTSGPSIAGKSDTSLDVVVRGQDNGLWHNHFNGGTWGGFAAVPGSVGEILGDPDCVLYNDGIMCVVRLNNNFVRMYYYKDIIWSQITTFNGPGSNATSGPTIASWSNTRMDIVVRGSDNAFYQIRIDNGGFSGWSSLGGNFTSDPECVSSETNRLECFGRGVNGKIWIKYWDGTQWYGWTEMSGSVLSNGGAGAAVNGGKIYLFIAEAGSQILWNRQTALKPNWYGWQKLKDLQGCLFVPFVKN